VGGGFRGKGDGGAKGRHGAKTVEGCRDYYGALKEGVSNQNSVVGRSRSVDAVEYQVRLSDQKRA
jgi:hypothetical protein